MYSVILCGGSGTRLWPLSRKNYPKQFLSLCSEKSLLQETFLRMQKIMPADNIFFITNKENYYNALNQIKDVKKDFDKTKILIEPASLNTAPAIAYAVKYLLEKVKIDINEPIVFLPSDHYIAREATFIKTLDTAFKRIGDAIGTIGIVPTAPKTAYGYIKKGDRQGDYYRVQEFKEKPDEETARQYLLSGQYVWNSGIYIFNAKTFINELRSLAPEIYRVCAQSFPVFIENFQRLPNVSIDVAISEKSDKVIVFEGDFGWSDIGSFDSLAEIRASDTGNGRHISIDSKNIFVHSAKNRLITTLGVEDLNIIENNDSILIHKKGRSEEMKKVVDYLKNNNYRELSDNIVDYRPWGKAELLIDTPTYKVKKNIVYPGGKISLQSHQHRTEHWIMVRGIAKVINAEKVLYLKENESIYVPPMTVHRLENIGKINVEFIEVQTGNYLNEDDIVRYDDCYGYSDTG